MLPEVAIVRKNSTVVRSSFFERNARQFRSRFNDIPTGIVKNGGAH